MSSKTTIQWGRKEWISWGLSLWLVVAAMQASAQTHPPKRELRGTWIATVKNIDWPSKAGLSTEEQKAELIDLLDLCKASGLNAVIFQIRPAGETFYNSPYEPWSTWLNGTLGQAPEPYYDPLQFAIEESHKRGMELHAWINPFRLYLNWLDAGPLPTTHVAQKYPDWTIAYGNTLYIDPGKPEAREYLVSIVEDVVRRYDIDAIQFDDYFYPYKIQGEVFEDSLSFAEYNPRRLALEDWRRYNINAFIEEVSERIYNLKPYVELGISPFGVWRNKSQDPEGSDTRTGLSSYDDLYADIVYWIDKGWIDYVAPQLYWSRGYAPADFEKLLRWWTKYGNKTKLYIGHALYKIANNADENWKQPAEMTEQIRLVRKNKTVKGSMFFSAKWLRTNPLGIQDSLQDNLYFYPSLTPGLGRSSYDTPLSPISLETNSDRDGIAMVWEDKGLEDEVKYFVVYRAKGSKLPLTMPEFQKAIIRSEDLYYLDSETRFLRKYTYVITAVNREGNESEASAPRSQRRWSRRSSAKRAKKIGDPR